MFDEISPDPHGIDFNIFYLVLQNEWKHFEFIIMVCT